MDATLQRINKGGDDKADSIDLKPVFAGLFSFFVKAAKRVANASEEELSNLQKLAMSLPEASDSEKVAIVETMMEQLFPEQIGGFENERKATEGGLEKLNSCRIATGRRIAAIRSKKGITQEELAEIAGVPQSHISRLENGHHTPTHLTIEKIAQALGVHPSEIDMGYPED
jgi:DNA-binding XRE family transcriptional regulator